MYESKKDSNEALKSLNVKMQLLQTFMDKGYSVYYINKENLIGSISKSTLFY